MNPQAKKRYLKPEDVPEAKAKKVLTLGVGEEEDLGVEQLLKLRDALSRLVENPELFKEAAEAYEKDDAERFRNVLRELGILRFCWLICRWFCVKIRGFVCEVLCPPRKPEEITVDEMLEFGRAAVHLMEKEDVFKALFDAYKRKDAKRFQSILREYDMIRFCVQFCRWFSHYYCTVKCRFFCPPTAKITSPSALACVQPKPNKLDDETVVGVEITGIASGGSPFLNYKLEYSRDGGATWRQDAPGSGDIVIVYPDGNRGGVSTTPVGPPADVIGYLDTTNLAGQTYSLKLTVTGGGGIVVTDTSQFQLHQKAVVINEVGRIPDTLIEPPPPPPEPPRKLILAGIERAVGGYATIGGSAYVEGCGQRYKRYKLMRAVGWIPPPAPATDYDDVGAPGPWQLIMEVDYTGMPVFVCFHNNEPVGDLTRRWVKRKCPWGLFDYYRLEWDPWRTSGSGKVTLLLAVQDDATPPNTYFDHLQIWLDNIAIDAKLDSIGIPGKTVDKCKPLSIEEILESGGILEIMGTAWDNEIEPGNLSQPSLNFDHFDVRWKKNCDPFYHSDGIELMPPANPGKERIKDDVLATWNIKGLGLEPCAYIIQLRVWDNSRINDDGPHYDHKELAFTLEA